MLVDETMAPVLQRPAEEYERADIRLRLGTRAERLAPAERRLHLADGSALEYDRLVLCCGGEPVLPRSLACPGVRLLRELDDLAELRGDLAAARSVAVVGGGFIGGEVASAVVAAGSR